LSNIVAINNIYQNNIIKYFLGTALDGKHGQNSPMRFFSTKYCKYLRIQKVTAQTKGSNIVSKMSRNFTKG
jgi:hypothetical protein